MKRIDIKLTLGLLAVLGFFGSEVALLNIPSLSGPIKDILLILIGAQVTIVKDVYGYYFGSSEGSARKTEMLTQQPPQAAEHALPGQEEQP